MDAGTSVVTVIEAGELRAVFSAVAGGAGALAINTETITMAVVGTGAFSTVLPRVPLVTVAGAVHTAPSVVAVFRADEFRAVEASPGFVAHAVSVFTVAAA